MDRAFRIKVRMRRFKRRHPRISLAIRSFIIFSATFGAAYGFICVAVVVWVASVARRARRLEDEVDELKKKLQARG